MTAKYDEDYFPTFIKHDIALLLIRACFGLSGHTIRLQALQIEMLPALEEFSFPISSTNFCTATRHASSDGG